MITLSDALNGNFSEPAPVIAENLNTMSENFAIMSEMYADIVMAMEELNTFDCAHTIMESAGNPVVMEGFVEAVKNFFRKIGDFFKWLGQKLKKLYDKIKNTLFKKNDADSDKNVEYELDWDLTEVFEVTPESPVTYDGITSTLSEVIDKYEGISDELGKIIEGKNDSIFIDMYPLVGLKRANSATKKHLDAVSKKDGKKHKISKSKFEEYKKIFIDCGSKRGGISNKIDGVGEELLKLAEAADKVHTKNVNSGKDGINSKILSELISNVKANSSELLSCSKNFFKLTAILAKILTSEPGNAAGAGDAPKKDA